MESFKSAVNAVNVENSVIKTSKVKYLVDYNELQLILGSNVEEKKLNKQDNLWLDLEMDLHCYNNYVKHKYINRGFMNTLSTNDIYKLFNKIVKLNIVPETEDSDECHDEEIIIISEQN
jgi:hypothetical protein